MYSTHAIFHLIDDNKFDFNELSQWNWWNWRGHNVDDGTKSGKSIREKCFAVDANELCSSKLHVNLVKWVNYFSPSLIVFLSFHSAHLPFAFIQFAIFSAPRVRFASPWMVHNIRWSLSNVWLAASCVCVCVCACVYYTRVSTFLASWLMDFSGQ